VIGQPTGLLTLAAGWLSYHLFEKWFLGLKERVAPRWSPVGAQDDNTGKATRP
jgi:peptidoglycan/LPS O-acetylase OafA/YrhL